jgi:multicomponent Na+:H+ antiporter subunit A
MALTLAIGVAVYLGWDPLHARFERLLRPVGHLSAAALYERSLAAIPRLAAACTRALQHGRSPAYATLTIGSCAASLLAVLVWALPQASLGPWPAAGWPLPGPGVLGACLLIVAGAVGALWSRQRLVLLLTSGLVGYGSALLFLFAGAPDLAFTQFAVETVFVIVVACVLLVLARGGRPLGLAEPAWRPLHALVAVVFASVVVVLLLWVSAQPLDTALSQAFGAWSLPQANGRNVVNVILVDFRALDTLGEITVVLLSLAAALPLLQALRRSPAGGGR